MEIDTQPTLNYNDVTIRPLHCRLNAQTRSDGSSMLTQGIAINPISINQYLTMDLFYQVIQPLPFQ